MSKMDITKLLELCAKCDKTLKVSDISEIIKGSFSVLYNDGTVLKDAEKKLGEEEFNLLLTSIIATLLANIYSNVEELKEEDPKVLTLGRAKKEKKK